MAKTRPGWRLYPRGFIGGIPATKMEKMEPRVTSFSHEQGRIVVSQPGDSELCVNDNIEYLYATYIKCSGQVTTLEYRDKILKAALIAFGTMSFFRWYTEQRVSPGMGDLQYRFLADTLRFIQGGRRMVDIQMWETILTATQATDVNKNYVEACYDFFGAYPTDFKPQTNDRLIDVIQMWCSRPNGIEDLLQSLHLLFGNP